MRIRKIKRNDIQFTNTQYEESLKSSILRIGLSFPIKVKVTEQGFVCVDGNKRLTALSALEKEGLDIPKEVHCIVVNDGSSRSNDCWRSKNTH